MFQIFIMLVLAATLSACGDPKIDGTSDAALKKSVSAVQEKLPPEQRAKFKDDLQVIAFSNLDFKSLTQGKASAESSATQMMASLDGKSAADIAVEADRIRAQREKRERDQALLDMAELQSKKASAEAAKEGLARFKVSKSRFYKVAEKYSPRAKPVIELSVVNGTDKAISRAYFKGTIASLGRSIPWLVKDFNYSISGGVELGESDSWTLAPNAYSEWGEVNAPDDSIFTVELVRLDGADNQAIYDAGGLSEREQQRLKTLQDRYPAH